VVEDLDGLRFRTHPRDVAVRGGSRFDGGDHTVQNVAGASSGEKVPAGELPRGQVQQHRVRAVREVHSGVLVAHDVDEAVLGVVLPPAVHNRAGERGLTCRDAQGTASIELAFDGS
jgi:hypothetical protein